MRTQYGFTLIETMVAIAILAIVISIAAPSFTRMLQSNRAAVLSNELVGALQIARSEALKRRTNVQLCPRNAAGSDCANSSDWSVGWLLIARVTVNNAVNTLVLRSWEPITGGTLTGPVNGVTYQSNGLTTLTNAANGSFTITTSATCSRTLQVSVTGNTSVDSGGCT
ncbi:peptidase [Pseudomonas oryzihabitans]|nr:peptidase [Pseudomonas psychrotolerans]KTT44587.1 peptidase [Pseudomonas psychrotolerans]KTT64150.1 peptidase [Pseudomonas psychrotolerans]